MSLKKIISNPYFFLIVGLGIFIGLFVFTLATRIMLYGIIPNFIGMMSYTLTFYWVLTWFLPYFIDRLLYRKNANFLDTLIFPAAVVLTEYFSNLYVGTWGSIAYTQYTKPAFTTNHVCDRIVGCILHRHLVRDCVRLAPGSWNVLGKD